MHYDTNLPRNIDTSIGKTKIPKTYLLTSKYIDYYTYLSSINNDVTKDDFYITCYKNYGTSFDTKVSCLTEFILLEESLHAPKKAPPL